MRSRVLMVAALFGAGCSSPAEPGPALVPAIIFGFYEDDPHISLELTGTTLSIEVNSYGNGCRSKGEIRTTVDTGTLGVTVAPFDWEDLTHNCPDYLATFEHSKVVELNEAGDWTVDVIGQTAGRLPVEFDFSVKVEI